MKEFCEWFSFRFQLSKEIALENLRSLKNTSMIFTDPYSSTLENENDMIYLEEKEYFDFEKKTIDHEYLSDLMKGKDYLLIR